MQHRSRSTCPAYGWAERDAFGRLVLDADIGGFTLDNMTLNAGAVVPEPASWVLMSAGFDLAGTALRRRDRTLVAA